MRADRLVMLVMLLQARGRMTARDLAERLGVSERTIYRDLDALSLAGVPVYALPGPGGGCAIDPAYRSSLGGLTADEVRSLALAGSPTPLSDLGLGDMLERVVLKLLASAPSAQRNAAEFARRRIYLDPDPWFQRAEPIPHLPLLQDAVWNDERVRIGYRRRDGSTGERVVEPHGLVAKAGVWYLVSMADGELRVFRVSRIHSATRCGEQFERDPQFDLATCWAAWSAAFTEGLPTFMTTLRVAREALHEFPPEVVATAGPVGDDGRCVVTMRFDILAHAASFVLGRYEHVEALEPPELRTALADAARRLTDQYVPASVPAEGCDG